jgi:protein TonB
MRITLDDMVFEHRNKAYGAYDLRTTYRRNLTTATLIGVSIFILGIGGVFAFQRMTAEAVERGIDVDLTASTIKVDEPPVEIPKEEPKPLVEPPKEVAQARFLPPEPKKDEEVVVEDPPPVVESLDNKVISNKSVEGEDVSNVFIPPAPVKEASVVQIEKAEEEEILISVEQQAEFAGDMGGLMKYLKGNVKYPPAASRANISGRVVLQFVVERDGSVGQIKVIKSVGFGCDEEAVRVVKNMPKWSPAKQNGRAVRSYFTLPVTYTLEDN